MYAAMSVLSQNGEGLANAKLKKTRIYIGDEYDSWMETNSEVAKILLDR
jgi:hypothetical protein